MNVKKIIIFTATLYIQSMMLLRKIITDLHPELLKKHNTQNSLNVMKMAPMLFGLSDRTQQTQPWVRIQIMMVTTDILALNCYLRKKPEACQIPRESRVYGTASPHTSAALKQQTIRGGDAPFVLCQNDIGAVKLRITAQLHVSQSYVILQ